MAQQIEIDQTEGSNLMSKKAVVEAINNFLVEYDPNERIIPPKVVENFVPFISLGDLYRLQAPDIEIASQLPEEEVDSGVFESLLANDLRAFYRKATEPSQEEQMLASDLHEELDDETALNEPEQSDETVEQRTSDQIIEDIYSYEFDNMKQKLQEKYEEELAAMRIEVLDEMAKTIMHQIREELLNTRKIIGDEIAQVLQTLAQEKIRKETLEDFVQNITHIAMDCTSPLTIEANAELLDALKKVEGLDEEQFIFAETSSKEIRLYTKDSLISTRLEPILNELREVIL